MRIYYTHGYAEYIARENIQYNLVFIKRTRKNSRQYDSYFMTIFYYQPAD